MLKISLFMKNNFFYGLALLTGIMLYTGCKKTEAKTENINSVTLYDCAKKAGEPYICFDSLITDSRCPKPAVCIWGGTAIIKVSFHERGNVHTFKMSLKDFPSWGCPTDTIISGYKIEFIDLKPYPGLYEPAPQAADRLATFNISH
jgi:hypothetical protein